MVRYFWSESNGTNRPTVRYMDFEPSTEYYNGMPLKKNEDGAVMPTEGDPEYICLWDYQPDGDIRTLEIPVIEIFPDTIYEKWNEDGTVEEVRFGSGGGGGLPSDLVETVPDEVPLEITWDGNLGNYETVQMGDDTLVKLSSEILTVEQIVGSNITFVQNGIEETAVLTNDGVMDTAAMGAPGVIVITTSFGGDGKAMVAYGDTSALGVSLSIGVWYVCRGMNEYTKSLSNPNVLIPGGERTQIKPEFLPKHLQFGESEQVLYSVENAEFPYSEDEGGAVYVLSEPPFSLENGKEYTVVWDGVEYNCIATVMSEEGISAGFLGNTAMIDGVDSGEPFVCVMHPGMTGFVDLVSSETVSHNISVETVEIKKIDNKFIDAEWMAVGGREQFEGEIVSNQTVQSASIGGGSNLAGYASNYDLIKEGDGLRVVWNGKDYNVTVKAATISAYGYTIDTLYAGNYGAVLSHQGMSSSVAVTGEPFSISFGQTNIQTGEFEHKLDVSVATEEATGVDNTISIYAVSSIVPLPEKFMPDLNQLTMISPSGKKFSVTVDDSGKLTAVEV